MIGFYNRSVILTYIGLTITLFGMGMGSEGKMEAALLCLIASGFCDMFDGKIARMTKRSKDAEVFGIQIDSLCDVICFGVLPAMLGYFMGVRGLLMIFPALFAIGGVIRLGYFNVQEQKRQEETSEVRKYYEGLPITSTALLFPIYYVILDAFKVQNMTYFLVAFYIVVGLLFIMPIRVKKPQKVMTIVFLVVALAVVLRLTGVI